MVAEGKGEAGIDFSVPYLDADYSALKTPGLLVPREVLLGGAMDLWGTGFHGRCVLTGQG